VKQKLLVNALLALCPVMLWVAHSLAGHVPLMRSIKMICFGLKRVFLFLFPKRGPVLH
jgi:hypothetical protein